MLFITIQNDGTGDEKIGNYDVVVSVNGFAVAQGRIEGHRRADGWRPLARQVASMGAVDGQERILVAG